jgi:predicted amidohydrolase YtcJ
LHSSLQSKKTDFIVGNGWDQNENGKSYFDKYFPDVPVVLNRVDGHAIIVIVKCWLWPFTKDTKVSGVKKLKRRAYWDINR